MGGNGQKQNSEVQKFKSSENIFLSPYPPADELDFDKYMLANAKSKDFNPHTSLVIAQETFDLESGKPGIRIALACPHMLSYRPIKINADGTYKMFVVDLKTLGLGFDDATASYHPVVEVLSTQEKEDDYKFALEAWKAKAALVGKGGVGYHKDVKVKLGDLHPEYILCDGAMSMRNAFATVFPDRSLEDKDAARQSAIAKSLMCGNHVQCVSSLDVTRAKTM